MNFNLLYLWVNFYLGKMSNQRSTGSVQIISPDGSVSSQDHSSSFYTAGSGQSLSNPKDVSIDCFKNYQSFKNCFILSFF